MALNLRCKCVLQIYKIMLEVIFKVAPTILLAGFNLKIMIVYRRSCERRRRMTLSRTISNDEDPRTFAEERRLILLLGSTSILFLVCVSPMVILNVTLSESNLNHYSYQVIRSTYIFATYYFSFSNLLSEYIFTSAYNSIRSIIELNFESQINLKQQLRFPILPHFIILKEYLIRVRFLLSLIRVKWLNYSLARPRPPPPILDFINYKSVH